MIAPSETLVCSAEQHAEILRHVRLGRLFELMDWVAAGLPTLIPEAERYRHRDSPIREAIRHGNHSMVRFMWEKCWQRQWEADSLVSSAIDDSNAAGYEIAKYLLNQDLPIGNTCAYSVFKSHDDELIYAALKLGLSVRGPNGFADALSDTGHSKHLLRLFRELRTDYPDLEMEGLLSLREAVENGNIRGAALLTWAGVDPLVEFPQDPYDSRDDEQYLSSVLEIVRLDDNTRAMLKALKIELTDEVWLNFLQTAGWLHPDRLADVWHWKKNPEEILLAHPEKAAEFTTSILKHLEGYRSEWEQKHRQSIQLKICEYLAHLGISFLVTTENYCIRRLRSSFAKVHNPEALVRLLWVIYARGDEAQRERLKEIVRTPKMQSIIRQYDRFLLNDLGLCPKRDCSVKISKRDRPWHIEDCKVTCPFERPLKVKVAKSAPRQQFQHYTPPTPEPTRHCYWNKWSHFHR